MQKTSPEKIQAIKEFLKKNAASAKSALQLREEEKATAAKIPMLPGIRIEEAKINGMDAQWITPEKISGKSNTILYYHGGAFVAGSCLSHRDIASRIAIAGESRVIIPEYRLAPEYRYPAANEDCLSAYRWLISQGIPAHNIILGGDSVGGYLVLMTLLALRNNGESLPKAAFLLSPHTDLLYFDGESYKTRQEEDPCNSIEAVKKFTYDYFGTDVTSPSILSPLNEDMHGLPPLFIQTGGDEVILDDSTRLCARVKAAGVDATLEIWENMWHIFRFMAYMLPEGKEALNHIGEFIKKQFAD